MFVRMLRLVFGSVRFEAKHGFTDRFINLCWSMKIPLWDVKRLPDGMIATTGRRSYRRLRKAAEKSGVSLHAAEKSGLPFLLRQNRMRAGILLGFALGVIFNLYVFSAVWQVNVIGCETLSKAQVLTAAAEEGLYRGAPRRSVDPSAIRRALVGRFPQINWCAVNVRGARAEIQLREVKEGANVFDESGVYDIVAAKDGQIDMIDAYRGKVLVRNLDTVTKGQLLISGYYETRNGTMYSTHAAGTCAAFTTEYIRASASPEKYRRLSRFTRLSSLYLFGARVPPFHVSGREKTTLGERDLSGEEYMLPIGFVTESAFDAVRAETLTPNEERLLSMMEAYDGYCAALSDAELIGADYQTQECEVRIILHLRENIAREQEVNLSDKE
ncbi:MAG: sporulation protein YqfD [Clostridia bacterium]|nr:sporulation protein YqfD [Clostridia bacterium]